MNEKTLEERFIKMYDEVTDRNAYLEMQIKSLQQQLDEIQAKEPQEEKDYIYLTNTPYYYYLVNIESTYRWNEYLKWSKKKPTLVEKARTDEKSFQQLCNLKGESYWRGKLAEIKERTYDYLFKDRKGRKYAIVLDDDGANMYAIGEKWQHFLSEDEADECLRKKMKENIEHYLQNYKEDF